MKKNKFALLGLALLLAGTTLFVSNQISATEDGDMIEKGNHQSTLKTLGIHAKTKDLESLNMVTDQGGKTWIYVDFTERTPLIEKMENKYPEEITGSFIEIQDKIMQKYAKVGDQIPIILLDEELQEGSFSFTRKTGETLSFEIRLDQEKGKWTYKERSLAKE
ncbi:hypothetical protein [Brevibacillus borstelensis]|uniref:hypothetical protein n=1 Tax=Brevibacillus borstelensis TaxID=45462 RepID=UPI0030BAF8F6